MCEHTQKGLYPAKKQTSAAQLKTFQAACFRVKSPFSTVSGSLSCLTDFIPCYAPWCSARMPNAPTIIFYAPCVPSNTCPTTRIQSWQSIFFLFYLGISINAYTIQKNESNINNTKYFILNKKISKNNNRMDIYSEKCENFTSSLLVYNDVVIKLKLLNPRVDQNIKFILDWK